MQFEDFIDVVNDDFAKFDKSYFYIGKKYCKFTGLCVYVSIETTLSNKSEIFQKSMLNLFSINFFNQVTIMIMYRFKNRLSQSQNCINYMSIWFVIFHNLLTECRVTFFCFWLGTKQFEDVIDVVNDYFAKFVKFYFCYDKKYYKFTGLSLYVLIETTSSNKSESMLNLFFINFSNNSLSI